VQKRNVAHNEGLLKVAGSHVYYKMVTSRKRCENKETLLL